MNYLLSISDHLPETGWEALRRQPDVRTNGPFETRQETLSALARADALIIRSTTVVDAELLDAAPHLRVVARAGARMDNVDIDEATRRGIIVINVPEANVYAVVEHAFALLLAHARHIPEGAASLARGDWTRHNLMGAQLHGKTVGVVGFGRLGREMAARCRSFGMPTLVYDPYVDLSYARELGVEIVGYRELLERADVVVPMTTYSAQTHHMLNAEAFRHMKNNAVLVNVVHAGLVDEDALLDALEGGQLAAAALDTFAEEPPPPGHPLLRHPRILAVPHLNQNTVESQGVTGEQVVADVLDALRGADYRNAVNLPFDQRVPYAAARPYIRLAVKLGKLQGQLAEGWITRVEVELLGEGLNDLVRPVAAVLLSGMLLPVNGRPVNWVSAPVLAHEQGVVTAQAKNLLAQADYPNLMICRIRWRTGSGQPDGRRTVAGVLFANGAARLVRYDEFDVDADPEGYVVILENDDVPGIIGKVGMRFGEADINIANWRYGRETRGGRAVSFINVDGPVPQAILQDLEAHPEIHRARLVRL